jgi:hypothetical protein
MFTTTRRALTTGAACAVMFGVMSLASPVWGEQPIRQVKNVDEKGRIPYQTTQLIITSTCSFNGILYFCEHVLPTVPASKRLVVEHVSMFAALSSGAPDSLRFINPVSNGTLSWVQPTFSPRATISTHFFLDRPVHVYYEPNQVPSIRFSSSGPPVSIEFSVHGYLIDAENDD